MKIKIEYINNKTGMETSYKTKLLPFEKEEWKTRPTYVILKTFFNFIRSEWEVSPEEEEFILTNSEKRLSNIIKVGCWFLHNDKYCFNNFITISIKNKGDDCWTPVWSCFFDSENVEKAGHWREYIKKFIEDYSK